MTKRMLIDAAHPEETRVVVMDGSRVEEFDLEAANRLPLKGNIYLARVVRVEPSLQAAFVEYGGNRHGFLAFDEIHPDYYQIPVADRERLLALQAQEAREEDEAEERRAAQALGRREPRRNGRHAGPAAEASESAGAAPTAAGEPPDAEAALQPSDDASSGWAERAEDIASAAAADSRAPEVGEGARDEGADASHANGHADAEPLGRVEQVAQDDAPLPETLGGPEGDGGPEGGPEAIEDDRPRRAAARFLRGYKIQEVIRRRQILLVQVVKEERGNKGAALTTYISLAGRFSVLMPNTPRGGGVSRKITSALDRRRLREVIDELEMPDGMSLIVRTAGANRPKPEIRRDCEYLLQLWDGIRERTLASTASALIYEEADLIKRCVRDGTAQQMDEILVEGDEAYAAVRDFVRMLMPDQVRKIQAYRDGAQPLFSRYGAEAQLDAMHEPVVQLKSGGYIVINQTEALVAIDVNSGRATRERHIEDTALKTNLEAADEVARQLRLRDLAGLVVVDFIDMESPKHNGLVEKRMKDALRHDRARIQVGRISHFGLLEMSRQRLRPSLAEQSFVTCPHCQGRGLVRSVESSGIAVLRAIEEEAARRRASEITVQVATPVALWLLNRKRDRLAEIEGRWGMSVLFEPDDSLSGAETKIERSRTPPAAAGGPREGAPPAERPPALRMDYAPTEEDEDDADDVAAEARGAEGETDAGAAVPGESRADAERRRRRRRRRGGRRENGAGAEGAPPAEPGDEPADEEAVEPEGAPAEAVGPEPGAVPETAEEREARRRRRGRRGGRRRREDGSPIEAEAGEEVAAPPPPPAHAPGFAYSGPTPADPFSGGPDSLIAAMEAAEAQALAEAEARRANRAAPPPASAATPAATPAPAPVTVAASIEVPEQLAATPATAAVGPAPIATASGVEAPGPMAAPLAAGPIADAGLVASADTAAQPIAEPTPEAVPMDPPGGSPVAAAPAPAQPASAEPAVVVGPAIQPKLVDDAEAPRRGGWWKR